MISKLKRTPVTLSAFPVHEWVSLDLQPTRRVPKKISPQDIELRENVIERSPLIIHEKSVQLTCFGNIINDNASAVDLRTGIMIITWVGPFRIDDTTLAFLRRKANWTKDTEVKHEVTLPQGARR